MDGARSSTWLKRTHQRWKVAVFGVGVAIASSLWATSYAVSRQTYPLWVHFAGTGAMAAALIWFGSAVRCRACGKSVAGWTLASSSMHAWFSSLSRLQRCPVCGDEGIVTRHDGLMRAKDRVR